MNRSSDYSSSSSDSDGVSERLKEAVCDLKTLASFSKKASNEEENHENRDKTSSSQLGVSKNTQKFLAKKLSAYLDSLIEDVNPEEATLVAEERGAKKLSKSSGCGVKLLSQSTCPISVSQARVAKKRKSQLPVPSSSSDEDDQAERERLSAAAVDPLVIKKQRLN